MLNFFAVFGAALIEHLLLISGFPSNCKLGQNFQEADIPKLAEALQLADRMVDEAMYQQPKARF